MISFFSFLSSKNRTAQARSTFYAFGWGAGFLFLISVFSGILMIWSDHVLVLSVSWSIMVLTMGIAWIGSKALKRYHTLQTQRDMALASYDVSPYAYMVCDPKGKILFINKKFSSLVKGRNVSHFQDLLKVFKSDARLSEGLEKLQNLQESAYSKHLDVPILKEAEQVASWWRISVSPLPSMSSYKLWCFADITPARHNAWGLEFDPSLMNALVNGASVGFFALNEEGKILYMNQTLCGWMGLTPQEALQQEFHSWVMSSSSEFLQRHPKGSTPTLLELKSSSGELCQCWVEPVQMTAQEPIRAYCVVKDLAQNLELLKTLEESRHDFENIFDHAPVGIAIIDDAYRVTGCNRILSRMAGVEQRDQNDPVPLESKASLTSLFELIDPEDHEKLKHHIANKGASVVAQENQSHLGGYEVRLRGHRMVSLCAMPFLGQATGSSAAPMRYVLYFVDMTEQKKIEFQFVQSQKMQAIGQLAGGIAHDFNNLLTAMIGFCDLLLLRHSPTDHSFGDIMQIKQNANRAANLVRQLLAFSRQQTLQPKVLNITDILAELMALLRRLLGASIELDIRHGRDLPLIKVDQGQLEQVIINLAVNARDAMHQGGALRITTQLHSCHTPQAIGEDVMGKGDYVLLKVEDTGEGIPPENLSRVFEPFFSTKEVGSGTGLGLSTVYGIIKQTGGFIQVVSVVGKGTIFSIYLPAYVASATAEPMVIVENKHDVVHVDLTGQGTILLAEDEDAVRMFSARALREKGYRVIEAHSGAKALEYLTQSHDPIDLLITDVVMPQMDGMQLIKKAREYKPHLKVIFISGYTEDNFRKKLDHHDVCFLSKPFTLQDLASKVKEILHVPGSARSVRASGSGRRS